MTGHFVLIGNCCEHS